jgi:hypothetical protein
MAVSIPFLKRVCCSSAKSSIKEEVVLIEGVVVLALTVDLRSSNRRANPPPLAEIK